MQDIKLYGRSDESDSGENPKSSITPRGGGASETDKLLKQNYTTSVYA